MRSTTPFIAVALVASGAVGSPMAKPQPASNSFQRLPLPDCNARFPKVEEYDAYNALENLMKVIKPSEKTITVPVGGELKALQDRNTLEPPGRTRNARDMSAGNKQKRQSLVQPSTPRYPDFVLAAQTCELVARYETADIWICNDNLEKQTITHYDAETYADFALGRCRGGSEKTGWEAFSAQMFHEEKWNLIIRKNSVGIS